MNRPPRKYFSEVILNLFTDDVLMISPDQLHRSIVMSDKNASRLADCHIYIIGRRPALSIDPLTFSYCDDIAEGKLIVQDGETQRFVAFRVSMQLGGDEVKVAVDKYPYRQLVTMNVSGDIVRCIPAMALPVYGWVDDISVRDFEVMYVGQAYGDGSRFAMDRLRSHSTLQRILTDTLSKRPYDELALFLVSYAPYRLISSLDGMNNDAEISDERDHEHWIDLHTQILPEKMQIGLAEAALIRYFQPEYNEIYKANFPRDDQKILEKCYRLDFCGLVLEINTEEINTPLYSKYVKKGVHHIAKFDLHDLEARRSFFSVIDQQGRFALANESRPMY